MEKLHFDFRDILWAPARALSAKQIFVMTFFVIAALVVYDIFYYLAQLLAGARLSLVFSAYNFFPFENIRFYNPLSQVSLIVGIILAVLTVMMGFFGVAAINIEAIRGNRFFSNSRAVRFAFKRFKQLFLSELAIIIFVAFVVFLFFLLGLISRLPYIGDWLFVLLFVLPNFIIALLTVFIIFIFALSVVLLPAVAAAERQGESFSVILETFSTVIRQPARWFGYTFYSLVAAKVCGFIYAYFAYRAVQFIGWATSLGGGDRINRLIKSGLSHLPVNTDLVRETFNIFPGLDFSFSVGHWALGGTDTPAGYLMAVMLFFIFVSIIGYMLAIVAAAQARAFVVIRYKKDDYNIAEEKSLFFADENINPEIDEGE